MLVRLSHFYVGAACGGNAWLFFVIRLYWMARSHRYGIVLEYRVRRQATPALAQHVERLFSFPFLFLLYLQQLEYCLTRVFPCETN